MGGAATPVSGRASRSTRLATGGAIAQHDRAVKRARHQPTRPHLTASVASAPTPSGRTAGLSTTGEKKRGQTSLLGDTLAPSPLAGRHRTLPVDTKGCATQLPRMQKRRPARGPEPPSANADLSRMRTVRTSRYAHDRARRYTSFDVPRRTSLPNRAPALGATTVAHWLALAR